MVINMRNFWFPETVRCRESMGREEDREGE